MELQTTSPRGAASRARSGALSLALSPLLLLLLLLSSSSLAGGSSPQATIGNSTAGAFARAHPRRHRHVLLRARAQLEGGGSSSLAAWPPAPDSAEPCGDAATGFAPWPGVACDGAGQVVGLTLGGRGLRGSLPDGLAELGGLTFIDLSNNSLTGGLPPAWSALADLEVLALQLNSLTGPLPAMWAALGSLRELRLHNNSLEGGGLPAAWGGGLTSLQLADLSHNPGLGGPPPPAWGRLAFLRGLALRDTGLAGSLPGDWSALQRLIQMDVAVNRLTGTLPLAWAGPLDAPSPTTSTSSASTSSASTSTSPTSSFAAPLSRLRLLDLSSNGLVGPLHPAWSRLAALQTIDLRRNALSGTVPEAWGALRSLAALRLAGNEPLCGPLPGRLQAGAIVPPPGPPPSAAAATYAAAAGGNATGTGGGAGANGTAAAAGALAAAVEGTRLLQACPWAPAAAALLRLRAGLTDPSGALADWAEGSDPCGAAGAWAGVLCTSSPAPFSSKSSTLTPTGSDAAGSTASGSSSLTVPMVTGLRLSGLGLRGPLPGDLALLGGGLQGLELDGNGLTGTLPPSWSALTGLSRLSLARNTLGGPLPPDWSALTRLSRMDLSYNGLRGPLPEAWGGGLGSLQELNLDSNSLNSTLPAAWAAASEPSAPAPSAASSPSGPALAASLRSLSLDANVLTGPLPPAWSGLGALRELSLRDNLLRGEVPEGWPAGMTGLRYLGLTDNPALCGPLPAAWAGDASSTDTGRPTTSTSNSSSNTSSPGTATSSPSAQQQQAQQAQGLRIESGSTQIGVACPAAEGAGASAASTQLWAVAGASAAGTLVLVAVVAAAVTAAHRRRLRNAEEAPPPEQPEPKRAAALPGGGGGGAQGSPGPGSPRARALADTDGLASSAARRHASFGPLSRLPAPAASYQPRVSSVTAGDHRVASPFRDMHLPQSGSVDLPLPSGPTSPVEDALPWRPQPAPPSPSPLGRRGDGSVTAAGGGPPAAPRRRSQVAAEAGPGAAAEAEFAVAGGRPHAAAAPLVAGAMSSFTTIARLAGALMPRFSSTGGASVGGGAGPTGGGYPSPGPSPRPPRATDTQAAAAIYRALTEAEAADGAGAAAAGSNPGTPRVATNPLYSRQPPDAAGADAFDSGSGDGAARGSSGGGSAGSGGSGRLRRRLRTTADLAEEDPAYRLSGSGAAAAVAAAEAGAALKGADGDAVPPPPPAPAAAPTFLFHPRPADDRNELACLRLVSTATAAQFADRATVHLSEPVPRWAFLERWCQPGACKTLTRGRRQQLVTIVAASNDVPNLELALAATALPPTAWNLRSAAFAGALDSCEWLLGPGGLHLSLQERVSLLTAAAASKGLQPACARLLQRWPDLAAEGAWRAAQLAAFKAHVELAEWLLGEANPGVPAPAGGWVQRELAAQPRQRYELLTAILRYRDLPAVQRLFEEYGRPDDHGTELALQCVGFAVASATPDWADKASWLLAQGAELKAADCYISLTCMRDEPATERFEWLAAQGCLPTASQGMACLEDAVARGDLPALRWLLERRLQLAPGDLLGAAMHAAERGDLEVLQAVEEHFTQADKTLLAETAAGMGHVRMLEWALGDAPFQRPGVLEQTLTWLRLVLRRVAWPRLLQLRRVLAALHIPHPAWLTRALTQTQPASSEPELFSLAAGSGSVATMRWLAARGYPMHQDAWSEAESSGCEAAVELQAELGCPMPVDGAPYTQAVGQGEWGVLCQLRRAGLRSGAASGRGPHGEPSVFFQLVVAREQARRCCGSSSEAVGVLDWLQRGAER
ncbi:hypothetical protein HYH03_003579 [Edaphochlamys debaryana]|uniref:Leucine-rich repeat-containing N-terminal plant-type domain-containing protein n=1 Tax=Edaphochlamys debaryana TaxID=47281 RepID=A0A835YIL3_9CHLO|nr:hypothetical protein HYH03_003579 [Edaphochlamys debaryana]|eukprot:KAG2498319.1 hypothetical protein HYH03_003579 [Edaphochlamys debaryana]